MSLDNATVRRIATLARIEVLDSELQDWAKQLNGILGWIEQLKEVNTDSIPPMSGGTDVALPWRVDAITDGGYPERVLANAPERHGNFFAVPKVVE